MKVDTDKVDEEFKPLVKENMTRAEVSMLGHVILMNKIEKLKNRWAEWKRKVRK